MVQSLVIFASDLNYVPAVQLIDLFTLTENYKVRVLNRFSGVSLTTSTVERLNLNTVSKEVIQDYCQGAEVVFMLIMPTDLADVTQLTRSLLEIASAAGVRRFAWVAPACPGETALHDRLSEAAALIRASTLETLVLYHAPLLSDLLEHKKELKFRRTLSLPLGNNRLPWLAPEVIANALYRWGCGELTSPPSELLTGSAQLSGQDIAAGLSEALKQAMNARQFAQMRFQAIDLDRSGQIDAEELFPYLLDLGYSQEDAQTILEQADTDRSGTIDFEEFIGELENHLNKILANVSTDVRYFDVSTATALHDWMIGGISENVAEARLEWIKALNQYGLPEQSSAVTQWLNLPNPSLSDWASQQILELVNVYILPGRGILTISEGALEGRPAIATRLLQADDRMLIGQRTLDGELLEWRWAKVESSDREEVRYVAENGNERTLTLQDNKLASLSVRGRWPGRRLAIKLFFQDRPLPRWQVTLFRELGELQIEEAVTLGADSDVICNCTGTTCGRLRELVESGLDTLEGIAEKTQVTMICGGCQPLVEEMLGSASLAVAELITKQDLGRNLLRLQFRPVYEDIVASKPGQHIVIQGRVEGRWVTRAYTLSSPADQTEEYEITVKREELGLFSRWLSDRANSEALIRISQPRGEFFLADEQPVVFFAGGIGVTPAIAMMRTLARRGDSRPFHLDYSAPHMEDFVFRSELEQLTAAHPNLTFTLRATRSTVRLDAATVRDLYSPSEGKVAFMCGPQVYMDAIRDYLQQAGWSKSAIREELFSSKLDDEGKAQRPVQKKQAIQLAGGINPIEHDSFDIGPVGSVLAEAEAFLKQCYLEQGLNAVFLSRWQEVKAAIEQTGTYEQTYDELSYGARLAWRNSSRCVGRYFWQTLNLRDMRHLETEEEMFEAILGHIKYATNNGDLRVTMTLFKPDGRRLWNSQLLRYAAYRQSDGTILGDPANLEISDWALKLGWSAPESKTAFDILPLIIQLPDKAPKLFEIPSDLVMEVPFTHPRFEWFAELGLKWYVVPAVSSIAYDVGGIQYTCAPFNGFYMGTEIGGRNFSDTYRYNLLFTIAQKMGLDTSDDSTLWKDSALVELNIAIIYSFKKYKVRMLDHHAMGSYFIKFMDEEKDLGRPVYADWGWIIPPVSGSTAPAWPLEMENRILKPNYFYQPDPWKTESEPVGCPFHQQSTTPTTQHCPFDGGK